MALLELSFVHAVGTRLRDGRLLPRWFPYVSTILEVGGLTVGTALGYVAPGSPHDGFVICLMLLLALSTLRLSLPVASFTGGVVASGYLFFSGVTSGLDEAALWMAVLMVGSGVGVGLVAKAIRLAMTRLVAEVEAREHLQADLLTSVEATQVRIGRELHDSVGSHLTGTAMFAKGLVRRAERGATVEAPELSEVAGMVGEALRQVRQLARGLTPSEMEPGGLPSALATLAAHADRAAPPSVSFHAEGDTAGLGPEVEGHLYRIAQEALANALRHGHPSRIAISLVVTPAVASLVVEDDGTGFPAAGHADGVGLRTMRHRADLVGGSLGIGIGDAGGVRIHATAPNRGAPVSASACSPRAGGWRRSG